MHKRYQSEKKTLQQYAPTIHLLFFCYFLKAEISSCSKSNRIMAWFPRCYERNFCWTLPLGCNLQCFTRKNSSSNNYWEKTSSKCWNRLLQFFRVRYLFKLDPCPEGFQTSFKYHIFIMRILTHSMILSVFSRRTFLKYIFIFK